jgi:aspartate ammonia-lyase
MDVRVEHDGLGAVEVPADALWGAQTQRALANFAVGGPTLAETPALLRAYAEVKWAAASANVALGCVEDRVGEAISAAAEDVAAGRHDDAFPLPVLQGGGGTSTNMNLNEVLANLADEALGGRRGGYAHVHPLDHVNRSQSTNDTYPTALALATVREGRAAAEALDALAGSIVAAAARAGDRERLGRTCLQDAVPVRLGATLGASASGLARTTRDLRDALDRLLAVPLGATAVGTGIGAPDGFATAAVAALAEVTGLATTCAADRFDGLQHVDGLLAVASELNRAWLVAAKLAADLRLLASGPRGGIGEARLPDLQPGSSIMPGKVNPVLPELVLQVGYDLSGVVTTVEAAARAGELELNVMEPVIAARLLPALGTAARAAGVFAARCVDGLDWDDARLSSNLRGSLAQRVERAARDGHDAAGSRSGGEPSATRNTAE